MKPSKVLLLTALVLPLTIGTTGALAHSWKSHEKAHRGECRAGGERAAFFRLELTPEQKQQLKTLYDEAREQRQAEHHEKSQTQQKAFREKIQNLMMADVFDSTTARTLVEERTSEKVERAVKMMEHRHQMLSVLTPAQKAEYFQQDNERMRKCHAESHVHGSVH